MNRFGFSVYVSHCLCHNDVSSYKWNDTVESALDLLNGTTLRIKRKKRNKLWQNTFFGKNFVKLTDLLRLRKLQNKELIWRNIILLRVTFGKELIRRNIFSVRVNFTIFLVENFYRTLSSSVIYVFSFTREVTKELS